MTHCNTCDETFASKGDSRLYCTKHLYCWHCEFLYLWQDLSLETTLGDSDSYVESDEWIGPLGKNNSLLLPDGINGVDFCIGCDICILIKGGGLAYYDQF